MKLQCLILALLCAAVYCQDVTMFNLNQWWAYRDAQYAMTQVQSQMFLD